MKFEIHFSVGEYSDYLVVEGDDIEEVKANAKRETDRRGLDEERNHLWSREIID